MISAYIRELKRYTYDDLKSLFKCDDEPLNKYISRLKEYSILKVVPYNKQQKDLTELNEDDIEISPVVENDNQHYYVFDYVGLITIDSIVLKIYPKYIKNNKEPKSQLKQVLKVIEKFNKKEQTIKIFNDSDYSKTYNNLAVCLYFMNDYFEYGLYYNEVSILEENGTGEIYWDKTINDAFTLISDNKPYYPSVYTKKRINDEFDFFKELHATIISKCCNELKEADLLDLFDLTEIYLNDKELDEYGDIDYILYRLENEINIQFNTRKNNLLKMMYAYISTKGTINELEYLNIFGTNSFNLIWEDVCKDVLNDHLNTPLYKLPLLYNRYEKSNRKLIDIIEKPKWIDSDEEGIFSNKAKTLIPDTIVIDKEVMIIYDAKYYCFENKRNYLRGQPGIESITKQYLYQLAYKDFAKKNGIKIIRNCFIIPTEGNEIINKGKVELNMLGNLELEPIKILLLPTQQIFKLYLSNKKFMDIKSQLSYL
jgi:hypothetical protein